MTRDRVIVYVRSSATGARPGPEGREVVFKDNLGRKVINRGPARPANVSGSGPCAVSRQEFRLKGDLRTTIGQGLSQGPGPSTCRGFFTIFRGRQSENDLCGTPFLSFVFQPYSCFVDTEIGMDSNGDHQTVSVISQRQAESPATGIHAQVFQDLRRSEIPRRWTISLKVVGLSFKRRAAFL